MRRFPIVDGRSGAVVGHAATLQEVLGQAADLDLEPIDMPLLEPYQKTGLAWLLDLDVDPDPAMIGAKGAGAGMTIG